MAQPDSEATRCARLRDAMGFHYRGGQAAFAEYLGATVTTWNNVECGKPLS